MRVVVIGDVGVVDGMMHIGDEAMFEAMTAELRARGARITGISSAPEETASRYGIAAIDRIGFDLSAGRDAAEQRLALVLRAATDDDVFGALPQDDSARGVIDAVRSASGVAVAGGGNLASTWPQHAYERRALAGIARALGRPVVVSGQTLGPHLVDRDRELVAELFADASLVGLREGASFRLARQLAGPDAPLTATVDDASFLVSGSTEPDGHLLVSLSTHLGGRDRIMSVAAIAGLLDRLTASSGLPVRFLAHFGSLEDGVVRGDSVLHEEVRAAMSAPSEVIATSDSRAAADAARHAELLVTSRYHPAVFAVPAGVPTVAIAVDDYTRIKLRGALGNFGQDTVVALDDVLSGAADRVADAAWAKRDRTRAEGTRISGDRYPEWSAWWDRVADLLR